MLQDGRLFPEDDGTTATVASKDGSTSYLVNETCPCKASQHRQEVCYHRLALRLYQKVCDVLTAEAERYTLDLEPPARPTIPADGLTMIQGRPFVKFEALLHLAHQCGLVRLEATIVQFSEVLAVCQSMATFQDGRVFTDIGDATDKNVAKHLAPHFIRMASTRSSARALRRALDITHCAVEELGSETVTHG